MTGDSEFRANFLRIVGGQDHADAGAVPAPSPAPPTPYDNLPAGIFTTDGDGVLTSLNATMAGWLRGDAGQLVGRPFAAFVVEAQALEADDGGTETGRVTLVAEDGTSFDAVMMQHEMASGAIEGVLLRSGVMPADPEGDDTAAPPDWLFASAPVGIVILDLDGLVSRCNPAFGRLLGTDADNVTGHPFTDLVVPDDQGEVTAALSKVVMGTARAAHLDVRMPGPRGRELAASLYMSPVRQGTRDGAGGVSGLVLHFIDATEHKNLELQFAQSQKMQAVGQLAGGVAHDFNNLLTAMIGFADLLLERHGPDDPDFGDIMQIKQNANRATNLVRQLLAFSRKQKLEPVILDVTESLSELTHMLGRLLGETVELRMRHGRDLGPVRVDKGQFDQVIINLAVNARDAMPTGGVLSVTSSRLALAEPLRREVDPVPAGNYVRIDVADTGTGIPADVLAHIFEPFFSTKQVGEGTGLGLSTVHGIIHQSDGYVLVESAPGAGTTFSILLPEQSADAAEVARRAEKALAEADLTGRATVLLVEDEDAVRMVGRRALENKGYTVLEAPDGEAALDLVAARKDDIDLILSDVIMPVMDGHTLVKLVRQELPDVKVILMSGYAEDV
ncbi:MAG: PAS domain-containing protein, partial [Proteobacteria bacterium]|nr:PAS domain-containing protein [Pseudomonadota bacterium]